MHTFVVVIKINNTLNAQPITGFKFPRIWLKFLSQICPHPIMSKIYLAKIIVPLIFFSSKNSKYLSKAYPKVDSFRGDEQPAFSRVLHT